MMEESHKIVPASYLFLKNRERFSFKPEISHLQRKTEKQGQTSFLIK